MQASPSATGVTLGSRNSFWELYLRVGFVVLALEAAGTVGYAVSSRDLKYRAPLIVLAGSLLVVAVAFLPAVRWLAARSWRARFSTIANLATGVGVTAAAAMDGGIDSHLIFLGVLPVINAGLALGFGVVLLCGAAALAELSLLFLADPHVTTSDNVVVLTFVLLIGSCLLASLYALARTNLEYAEANEREELIFLAKTDPLTGCSNHRTFNSQLDAEVDRFSRYGAPLSLMVIDVDHFKTFNDERGHQAGDDALAALGALLRGAARKSDIVARTGGDEFAIILPSTTEELGVAAASRLVKLVEDSEIGLSLSIGVSAIHRDEPTTRRIYADADAALYRAKALGRGRAQGATAGRQVRTSCDDALIVPIVSGQEDFDLLADEARKRTAQWAEGRAQMDAIMDAAPFGMCFVDDEFRIRQVNRVFARFSRTPTAGQTGRKVEEIAPEIWSQLEQSFRHVLETGTALTLPEVIEDRVSQASRTHFWLVSLFPVQVETKVVGLGVIGLDVTDRKELEAAESQGIYNVATALAAMFEAHDPGTAGHEARVSDIAVAVARDFGWPREEIEELALASRIHDLGNIRIPSEILARSGRLNSAELEVARQHVQAGYDIMKAAGFAEPICETVLQHHERLDGSGYPQGLAGPAICPAARVLAVADVADAMLSPRPHRPALPMEAVITEFLDGRGTRYDEAVVDAYLRLFAGAPAVEPAQQLSA